MRKTRAAQFLIGVLLLLSVFLIVATSRQKDRHATQIDSVRKSLQQTLNEAHPQAYARRVARRLLPRLRGRTPEDPEVKRVLTKLAATFSSKNVRFVFLDSREQALCGTPHGELWLDQVRERIGGHWYASASLKTPRWRVGRVVSPPDVLFVWHAAPPCGPGKIAQVIVQVDLQAITRRRLLETGIRKLTVRGLQVGLWDQVWGRGFGLAPELSAKQLPRDLKQFLRGSGEVVRRNSGTLLFVPAEEGRFLVGKVPPSSLEWDRSFGLVLAGWVILCLWLQRRAASGPSLRGFLGWRLLAAAGIPLLLTFFLWNSLAEHRLATLINEEQQQLEQTVINLDQQMFEMIRERRDRLNGEHRRFEALMPHIDPVMDRLALLELESRTFLHFWVVSSQGVNLRDFSMLDPSLRHIGALPRHERHERLQGLLRGGKELPSEQMYRLAMAMEPISSYVRQLWECRVTVDQGRNLMDAMGLLGKILIQRYNQQHRTNPGGEDEKSSMVYGSVIDSQTGDLIRLGLSSLGRLFLVGSGFRSAFVWMNLVRSPDGAAQYFLLSTIDLRGLEHTFLEDLFRSPASWPEQMQFAAESPYFNSYFPVSGPRTPLRQYFSQLIEPNVLKSEVTTYRGRKVLLTAYACRHMNSLVLFAMRPWEVVAAKEDQMRQIMGVLAGIMIVLLLGIAEKLYRLVVVPADALMEGIRAMEEKRFDHRITLKTGDEWDEIADSFHATLDSLEELEVARAVQSMLLPQHPITTDRVEFYGKSLMTGVVGGDFFDAIPNPDGSMHFIIVDVTGHGVSAAMITAMMKSAFHYQHQNGIHDPNEILTRMSKLILAQVRKKLVATAQCGQLFPDGRLVFANAGHPYPLALDAGNAKLLENIGPPLGLFRKTAYKNVEHRFASPTARVFLYSDGCIEQDNASGKILGMSGLEGLALKSFSDEAPQMIDRAFRELANFAGGKPLNDDVTFAVISLKKAR
jgi:sigma-B regulation protein RsbU (phosphoserine phosphatase)